MLMQRKKPIFTENLSVSDPELFSTIEKENKRQEQEIELIASENITSLAEAEESNQLEQWKPDPDASITMEGDIEARKLALGMNYEYLKFF